METLTDQQDLLNKTIWNEQKLFPRDRETLSAFWKLRKGPEHTTVSMYLEMEHDYLEKTLGTELCTKVKTWIASLGIQNIEGYPLFQRTY